jgi:sRNA-binding protein
MVATVDTTAVPSDTAVAGVVAGVVVDAIDDAAAAAALLARQKRKRASRKRKQQNKRQKGEEGQKRERQEAPGKQPDIHGNAVTRYRLKPHYHHKSAHTTYNTHARECTHAHEMKVC